MAGGVPPAPAAPADGGGGVAWTPALAAGSIFLFLFAGLVEIGGGWLVWQCVRERRPWYFLLAGARGGRWLPATRRRAPPRAIHHVSRLPSWRWNPNPPPPRLRALAGAAALVGYGLIPTLQPRAATFSRVYAAYGGVFIVLSYAWGAAVDRQYPDRGDYIGAATALAGVALAWFWPRG